MSARRHKAAAENPLRFTTRNYKHELRLDPKSPRSILEYTDEVWETLCSNVAANGFTGLTFYSGYHPFEYVLDYRGFEKARMHPARQNARVRKAFNRALAVAHRHGLKTFIQHYITHFTPRLAKSLKIHTRGRLADVDQPEINRYQRWCYREMFRQCPDLDGLYFNFESVSRAYEQIRDTAVREFNRMKRKPIMFLRLWGANDPEGIRMIVRIYRGRVIVGHKIPDTNDTYYLPVADSRVTEWKRTLPDVEFAFLVGPCHNCGTNLCQNLWADYDFVQQMLADAERKGADSISFHTITEFFAPDVKGRSVFDREELVKARFNVLHLDAAIDYFHNRTMTPAQRSHWMAERAGVDAGAGKPLYEAVHASSQLILLAFQQFCNTSAHDGYLNPGRYSPIQEPFFYFPANALNNQASRLLWHPSRGESAWLRKRIDTKVAPDDFLQPIIDYVDPSKPKATRNPKKLVNLLKRNAEKSFAAFRKVKRYASKMLAAQLETLLQENAALGEYVRREILAAVHLYGIYFAKGKAAVVKRLRAGLV